MAARLQCEIAGEGFVRMDEKKRAQPDEHTSYPPRVACRDTSVHTSFSAWWRRSFVLGGAPVIRLRTTSRRLLIASSILLTIIAWQVEALATQLTLTWADGSTNEQGYSIERGPGTTGPLNQIITTGPGVTTYTDSNLADATTYCYRVQAFNGAGSSGYSNTASATTPQVFGLAVLKVGAGRGTVTSAPPGIACGASCSGSYASGTVVTLTANAASGSTFTGWTGGGCSGTGTCTVTVTAATSPSHHRHPGRRRNRRPNVCEGCSPEAARSSTPSPSAGQNRGGEVRNAQ